MGVGVGLREAARQLGISHPRLLSLWKEGRVPRFEDGSWDVEQVRAAYLASTDGLQVSKIAQKSALLEKLHEMEKLGPPPLKPKPPPPPPQPSISELAERAGVPLPEVAADNDLLKLRKAQMSIQVKKGALDLKQREGELVAVADVAKTWSGHIANAKNILLLIPARLAPVLAGTTDALVCQDVLEQEVRRALNALAEYRPSET